MTKPTKKIENKTSKNLNISSKDKSIQVDNMERKFSKLTEMFTANEMKADMDLNEAAELLDEIDKSLELGIEEGEKKEKVVQIDVPVKQSMFTSNRLYLTLGISSFAILVIAVFLVSGGEKNHQSSDPLTPMIASEKEIIPKNIVAPIYGFTEQKGLSNTIILTADDFETLVEGLPVYNDMNQLRKNINSLAAGDFLRYIDESNTEHTICQIMKNKFGTTQVKLSLKQDEKDQTYKVQFTLDGKKVLSSSMITDHLTQWPELKTIIEREK